MRTRKSCCEEDIVGPQLEVSLLLLHRLALVIADPWEGPSAASEKSRVARVGASEPAAFHEGSMPFCRVNAVRMISLTQADEHDSDGHLA